ncbi:MAG: bifunctional hydroxymethylpyrimidine kinase/phosphomethylpyrimidine kinase [Halolamina sp.]
MSDNDERRRPAPDDRPVALTVAGSDAGGGAGIQADLRTMTAHGVFGTSAVTAATAQNTRGVESTHVLPPAEVAAQISAVVDDFDVAAAKTGMLATADVVETVTTALADLAAPLVVDPVMVAESGDRLLAPDAEAAYEDLLGAATVATPNADEAAVLTGVEVEDATDARTAAAALHEAGPEAVLVTGGHFGDGVADVLVAGDPTDPTVRTFESPRVDTDATHGTGCTLSSAIAARLARGDSTAEAVEAASAFLQRAVRYPLDVGEGPGAVHHTVGLRERAARDDTREAVEGVLAAVGDDVRPLIPEVGTTVAGATPYAESTTEVAAADGRLTRTVDGVRQPRGVRFDASSHVARFLLAAREFDPELRFAANVRHDDAVAAALSATDWLVAEFDRRDEPEGETTMGWGARRAFESVRAEDPAATPAAVVDDGAVGKEPMVRLLAADAETLTERVQTLTAHDAVGGD